MPRPRRKAAEAARGALLSGSKRERVRDIADAVRDRLPPELRVKIANYRQRSWERVKDRLRLDSDSLQDHHIVSINTCKICGKSMEAHSMRVWQLITCSSPERLRGAVQPFSLDDINYVPESLVCRNRTDECTECKTR